MARAWQTLVVLSFALVVQGQQQQRQQQTVTELQKAVEEFRVQTRALGLRADSTAQSKTAKTGSKWHGRLFENFRNNFIDAVPHEIVQRGGTKGLLQRNQYGFNVSGPVEIPKLYHGGRATFFSLTFEGVREKVARTYLNTIPTLPERQGDWGATVDSAGVPLPIYDPATTSPNPNFKPAEPVTTENLQYNRLPFAGNQVPTTRIDRKAHEALQFYPAPNSDAGPFFRNNLFTVAPETSKADGLIARVDHSVRERHRLGFGLNYSNGFDGAAPYFPNIANPGTPNRDRQSRRATVEHVFTASARSVNTLTLDGSTDRINNKPEVDANGNAFPSYQFSPYLSMGRAYPLSRNARNNWVLTNGYSTRRREHRLRVVGRVVAEQVNSYWPKYPSGSFGFSPGLTSLPGIVNTGHAFASFLLGLPGVAEQSVVISPSYFRKKDYWMALRDQWELRKGLTLSLGLNFDINTPRVEKYDRQSTIDMEAINPVNGRPGALATAGVNGRGRAFQPVNAKCEPSASLAWNVAGGTKTVARAGYSRSYSPIPIYLGQWGTQAFNGNPTWVSTNPQLAPALKLSDGFPPGRTFPDTRPEAANNTMADLIEPSGRQPTYQSFSLTLERELPGAMIMTIGLSQSGGHSLLLGNGGSHPNAIPLAALEYRDRLNDENFNRSLRPFPQYQRFDIYSSWPEGRYQRDSSYVRVEKRSSGGFSMSAYYEFAKQMDNYSGPYGVQDYYNRANEWAMTAGATPHRLSLTFMYELPFGANKSFLTVSDWRRYLVEGWSVSGVSTVASGEPTALRPQFNNTGGVLDIQNVNLVPGVDPHVSSPGPDLWFNPAAFSQPADFTTGNASRTHPSLRNPGNQNHDVSVTKRFAISSEQSMELSAVGLNFINHANWNDPDTMIGPVSAPNVNAGKIIGSRGSRVIQLGLRFSF
jgi:hypothetical protein